MSKRSLAQLFREARNEVGLSQERLAELVGVSPLTVSKFETGRRSPSLKTLAHVARVTGYPVSWFCDPECRGLNLPVLQWATDSNLRLRYVFGSLTPHLVPNRAEVIGQPISLWLGAKSPAMLAHNRAMGGQLYSGVLPFYEHWLNVLLAPTVEDGKFFGLTGLGMQTVRPASDDCEMLPTCLVLFRQLNEKVRALSSHHGFEDDSKGILNLKLE